MLISASNLCPYSWKLVKFFSHKIFLIEQVQFTPTELDGQQFTFSNSVLPITPFSPYSEFERDYASNAGQFGGLIKFSVALRPQRP